MRPLLWLLPPITALVASSRASAKWAVARSEVAAPAPPAGPEPSLPGGVSVQVDRSGKGAVLCSWGLLQAAAAVGAACHPHEDAAFRAELHRSLARIDAFVIANSRQPVTRADLDRRRVAGLRQLRAAGGICAGDAAKLYATLARQGAPALRAQTADLLSVPREPVMNPCL